MVREVRATCKSNLATYALAPWDPNTGDCGSKPSRTARTSVTKAEAAISLELALGVAADITVKVKIPDMNWNALRNGGGRGPIGYKDGQISFYIGGFLDAPGIATEIDSPASLLPFSFFTR